jgi:hypothetical protein
MGFILHFAGKPHELTPAAQAYPDSAALQLAAEHFHEGDLQQAK